MLGLLVVLALIVAFSSGPGADLAHSSVVPATHRPALVADSDLNPCSPRDAELARFRCLWPWTRDKYADPIRLWEREYAYRYEVEFAVNSISPANEDWFTPAQRRLTRRLNNVASTFYASPQPPYPVFVTTVDYTDMVHVTEFRDVVFQGGRVDLADAVAAVDATTGLLIDVCNRGSGFGVGTKVSHAGDAFVDNYARLLPGLLNASLAGDTTTLPSTGKGYFWGMDWFPKYPGHMVDDVLYHFASHYSSQSSADSILMLHSDSDLLHSFVNLVTAHYKAVGVHWVEHNRRYRASNVHFPAVQDTGYTPHVYRFLAKKVMPSVLVKYASNPNVTSFSKIIMIKATRDGSVVGSVIAMSEVFEARAASHNFTVTPAAAYSVEMRAYLVQRAELVLYSWGGTMAVQAYLYANLDRPLRMILVVPGGDHHYIEEGYKFGNIAGGRLEVEKWYETGEDLHHYMQPNTNVKIRQLGSAHMDNFTDDDFVFHDGAFALLHPDDKAFFAHWSADTQRQEISTRRCLVYNRLLQSTPQSRTHSRTLVRRVLFALGDTSTVSFVDGFDVSANYFTSRDDRVAADGLAVWCVTTAEGNVISLGVRLSDSSGDAGETLLPRTAEPRLSAWTTIEADLGQTILVADDLQRAVVDFAGQLLRAPSKGASTVVSARQAFWIVAPRTRIHLAEATQFFLCALGHHVMHGRLFDKSTFVVAGSTPDAARRVIEDLAAMVGAKVAALPDARFVTLEVQRLFVSPLLSPQWLQVTAPGHMMSAFLWQSLQRHSSAIGVNSSTRVACFLPDSDYVNDDALAAKLKHANISVHIALSPHDAIRVINTASTVILPYGPAVQYYLSFWGRTDRVLKMVILCPPWTHVHCHTGPFIQRPRWFYSLGQAFGGRNTEVRYVLTPTATGGELDTDVFEFDGIPSAPSFRHSTWQQQDPADVARLRQAYEHVVKP